MEPIKLVIADDERLIRSGLRILLEAQGDIRVVAEAENGLEAFHRVMEQDPDVVLMDIRMPGTNGIEGTRRIRERKPRLPVLILTTFQDTEYILEAMKLGAAGYLLKDSAPEAIADGIRLALAGKVVMDPAVSRSLVSGAAEAPAAFDPAEFDLSEKECEIIRHVASGKNNKEIAEAMYLSEGTIKNNITYILQKLDLRDRTQLAIFALERGMR